MASDNAIEWVWERTDPSRSGSSGDVSKLFRHETTKNPGVFKAGAPKSDATLMAREVIQNSWDAALDLQSKRPDAPKFELTFRFKALVGEDKSSLARSLSLGHLGARAGSVDRNRLGLRSDDCLNHLDEDEPLHLVVIEERGTTGMYGPWEGAKSHMYLALVSLGYTEKMDGSGGSYGFGKAGLIRGSATRTVLAYTCFEEDEENDPGVTRRLLGMTYWGQHELNGVSFTGFGRFGDVTDGEVKEVRPFINDEADRIAQSLGLVVRNPDNPTELGTTFLLIQPTVDAEDLETAIERSWWPALEDGAMEVVIETEDDTHHYPRPRRDPVLRSFIDAYEIARMPQDNTKSTEKRISFSSVDLDGEPTGDLGTLGLVVDLEGWSFPDRASALAADEDSHDIDHRSMVALVRKTRMVIEYLDAGHTPAFVRGVFIADDGVNDLLRRTEPKSHDEWQMRAGDENVDERAVAIAGKIIDKAKRDLGAFRRSHRAGVVANDDISLPEFDRFMNRVLSGSSKGGRQPVPDTRPVSIRLKHSPVPVGIARVKMEGTAGFALSEHCEHDSAAVRLSVRYRFVDDGRLGHDAALQYSAPPGFTRVEGQIGQFVGGLNRDEIVEVVFESEAYSADWSGRLIVSGDLVSEADEQDGEGE